MNYHEKLISYVIYNTYTSLAHLRLSLLGALILSSTCPDGNSSEKQIAHLRLRRSPCSVLIEYSGTCSKEALLLCQHRSKDKGKFDEFCLQNPKQGTEIFFLYKKWIRIRNPIASWKGVVKSPQSLWLAHVYCLYFPFLCHLCPYLQGQKKSLIDCVLFCNWAFEK